MARERNKEKEKSEFKQKLLDVARVARVVAGGRRFSFRTVVVLGDKKSRVGVGVAKGPDVTSAVEKATNDAKKNLITVPIVNETIPHQVKAKFRAAKVFLKPARKGSGIIAGGAPRAVVNLAGIKNVSCKILGSANKLNNARATVIALSKLASPAIRKKEEKEKKESAPAKTAPAGSKDKKEDRKNK